MSDSAKPESATVRVEVREAYAAAAADLVLAHATAGVEARCVGVAFAAYQRTIDAQLDDSAGAAPRESTAEVVDLASPSAEEPAIRKLLESWEALSPERFGASWRDYATEPYVGIGPGWVGVIDQATVDQWLGSPELREAMVTHPPHSPRQVTISGLQLVWLGAARVVATYRAEETYTNGKLAAGNTFAVLMKIAGVGWRITVASKGTRHEAPLRG
jgi:hypothetical protein